MPHLLIVWALCVLVATRTCVLAQTRWESSPLRFEHVPGNAGISLPVRWSRGHMQVLTERTVLPPALATTPLRRVRVRRAGFAADPAWASRAIDCELRLGSTQLNARQLTIDLQYNLPAGLTVVATRRVYNVPATPALGPGSAVGGDLIDLPLDAPWVFRGPNLFLDWRNHAPTLDVSAGHWVDAVDVGAGGDLGLAVPLGAHGCGSRAGAPMVLTPETSAPPTLGTAFPLVLRQARANAPGFLMTFLEPLRRNPLGLTFGQELQAMNLPGCYLWAGPDLVLPGVAGPQGDMRASVTLPNLSSLRSSQVTVQAALADPTANPLGVALSSGVLLRPDSIGVSDHTSTVLEYRAGSTVSPWPPFVGLTPVWLFGF